MKPRTLKEMRHSNLIPSVRIVKKIMILNLQGPENADEFAGNTPEAHLRLVLSHLPTFKLDIAIADPTVLDSASKLQELVKDLGGEVIVSDVARDLDRNHHDARKMSLLFSHIFH